MDKDKEAKVNVGLLRKRLLRQLSAAKFGYFKGADEDKFRGILGNTFENRSSSAVLVTGPSQQHNLSFVQKVLLEFQESREEQRRQKCAVAMIRGNAFGDDRQAMLHLAQELGFVTTGQNFGLNIEMLQDILKNGQLNSVPTVLILESFEEFAKNSRQILLYTLLDLMHRKDLLFAVVGLTCCGDVTYQLEKRVMSRLNAQFIELKPPSALDICKELSRRLTYHGVENDSHIPLSGQDTTTEEIDENMVRKFNESVITVFGDSSDLVQQTSQHSARKRKLSDDGGDSPPLALTVVEKYLKWNLRMFVLAAKKCALNLSNPPAITTAAFTESLKEMYSDNLFDVVSTLPKYELWMFAACLRLYCRSKLGIISSSSGKKRTDQNKESRGRGRMDTSHSHIASFAAGAAISDFEKIAKFGAKDDLLKRDLYTMLQSLENLSLIYIYRGSSTSSNSHGTGIITDETAIVLGVPPLEAKSLFNRNDLKLPDKIRRVVLEPLEPLVGDNFSGEESLVVI